LVRDLNRLYLAEPALHKRDCKENGFRWLIDDDSSNSVFAYLRAPGDRHLLAICNFTPVSRHHYRIGVPRQGSWREVLNTDSAFYAGSNIGNARAVHTASVAAHGQQQSLELILPPLATIYLVPDAC
jgi:1,4-alpha-glucan branching enzyme